MADKSVNINNNSGKDRKIGPISSGMLVIAGSILGSMLFMSITFFFVGNPMGDIVESALAWITNTKQLALSAGEREYIRGLVESGHILSPELYFSEITEFYNSVITILLGLMGVMGFAGFMYIKAVTRNEAEALAEEAVQREFRTASYEKTIEERISNILSDPLDAYFSDILERLELVEKQLDPIEIAKLSAERVQIHTLLEQMQNIISKQSEKLALTDSEEEVGGGLEISEDQDQGDDGVQ